MSITQAEFDDLKARGYAAVLSETVTLTNAQIIALPTTPVEIVAAPGSGKFISVVGGLYTFDCSHGHYSGIDASCLIGFGYGASPFADLAMVAGVIINDSGSGWSDVTRLLTNDHALEGIVPAQIYNDSVGATVAGFGSTSGSVPFSYENAALNLCSNNGDVFGGGGSGNTLKITLLYTIVDV